MTPYPNMSDCPPVNRSADYKKEIPTRPFGLIPPHQPAVKRTPLAMLANAIEQTWRDPEAPSTDIKRFNT
jgi:hypothetical protein